ncbi:MAG: fructosamine kinase family protein [Myxococcota bacterium]
MNLPGTVEDLIRDATGHPPKAVRPVGGGCINQAARVETDGGAVFVKWNPGSPPGFFGAEADGLERLAATRTVRVPGVRAVDDERRVGAIVMDWVPDGRDRSAAMEDAGRRLAELHARRGRPPGLERDNFIGSIPQRNTPPPDGRWLTFFREQRVHALAGALPARVRRDLEALDLEGLLTEPEGGCALLHGDLWGGNVMVGEGGAGWIVDPAVYHGHPEVDLAMTRLFGGFGPRFYDAYQEVAGPFDADLDARLEVLNLYPLLVHVHLFGGAYLGQVEAVVRRFAR